MQLRLTLLPLQKYVVALPALPRTGMSSAAAQRRGEDFRLVLGARVLAQPVSVSSERSSTATRGEGLEKKKLSGQATKQLTQQMLKVPVSTSVDPWTLSVEPGKHATPRYPAAVVPYPARTASDHPHRRGVRVGVLEGTEPTWVNFTQRDMTRPVLTRAARVFANVTCHFHLHLLFFSSRITSRPQSDDSSEQQHMRFGQFCRIKSVLRHCPDLLTPCRTFARDRSD